MDSPPTAASVCAMAAVELHGLRFRWPGARRDTLVMDELSIGSGRSVFLHGPSGCGKSTLLGLLAGVLLPSAGELTVLGAPLQRMRPSARDALRGARIGVIFQQFNLLPYLDVLGNVRLPCRFSSERHARAAGQHGSDLAAAQSLLRAMELDRDLWARRAGDLSVGQQQRVAAARALIGSPALVIADEPTSALDAALRDEFMALLLSRCRDAGSTLVFVSHDERLAGAFDERHALQELNRTVTEAPA